MLSNESFFWSFHRRAKGESSGLGIHPNHLVLPNPPSKRFCSLAPFSGPLGLNYVSCCFVLGSKCWGCCVFVVDLGVDFLFALSLRSQAFWPWVVSPAASIRARSAGGVVFLWPFWVWFLCFLFILLAETIDRSEWFRPGASGSGCKPLGFHVL